MSSNEFAGSPNSSALPDAETTGASVSGGGVPNAGVHAANRAEPVTMPAALRKSRRERYSEWGVISDDLTVTDLYLVSIITSSYRSLRVFKKQPSLRLEIALALVSTPA